MPDEYDDGFDSRESFERFEEDRPEDAEPSLKGRFFKTLQGEHDLDHEGLERFTPSGSIGVISGHNNGDTWDLVFPNGAWVCPTTAELEDPAQYEEVSSGEYARQLPPDKPERIELLVRIEPAENGEFMRTAEEVKAELEAFADAMTRGGESLGFSFEVLIVKPVY